MSDLMCLLEHYNIPKLEHQKTFLLHLPFCNLGYRDMTSSGDAGGGCGGLVVMAGLVVVGRWW